MLDAKSPQGMCHSLLNMLCTLISFTLLWFHCWGNANGSTWHCPVGKQGKHCIFQLWSIHFYSLYRLFYFFCCIDKFYVASYLPKALFSIAGFFTQHIDL